MTASLGSMPAANYLVSEVPQYRLIIQHFYQQHRLHGHYVRSDDCLQAVRQVFPEYDELTCRRHLEQLADWGLIRLIPEQSKPANLIELRQRPRIYQAERIAIRLEQLRADLQEESARAAAMHPTTLEQLVQSLVDLTNWAGQQGSGGEPGDYDETFRRWHALRKAFVDFARGVEDYMGDLPRHKPREIHDYLGFLGYREAITRYLTDYIQRLYQRREYIRHLLQTLRPWHPFLAEAVAAVAAAQVLADGSSLDAAAEADRCRRDLAGMESYFSENGDVAVVLQRAEEWIEEITSHARRLSEQHLGTGTVREQTLLDLAGRFAAMSSLETAVWLAQVAFAATPPLHWKGEAPVAADQPPWAATPTPVPLQAVRRGGRQRLRPDLTIDRTLDQFVRMQAESVERDAAIRELSDLFGPGGVIDLAELELAAPTRRQQILRLLYRALAGNGRASVGHRDWQISVTAPPGQALGRVAAPDGILRLPAFTLRLHRGAQR